MSANQPAARDDSSGWDHASSPNGGSWTPAQFERLSLADRVRLLASGELRFFRAGQEIPARDALRRR